MEPIINSQVPEFKVQAFHNGEFKTVTIRLPSYSSTGTFAQSAEAMFTAALTASSATTAEAEV